MVRKIKVKKGTVIKEIEENVLSLYLNMGWELYKERSFAEDEQPSKKFLKGNR